MGWLSKFKKSKPDEFVEEIVEYLTFKQRVEEFWKWFSSVAPRFHSALKEKDRTPTTEETIEVVEDLLPRFGWVFGPGEIDDDYSFTLTPEAIEQKRFLAEYWLALAPDIEGWTFYDARQPGAPDGTIEIKGERIKASAVWVTPVPDDDKEVFHISVWHPVFSTLEKSDCFEIIFLWLDEILGEKGTSSWIGRIEFSDTELKGAIPLKELRELTQETLASKGWNEKHEEYCSYTHEAHQGAVRTDIYVGSTCCFSIVRDYFENYEPFDDNPIEGLGAHYLFLSLSLEDFPTEDEVDFRGAIEDRIEARFTDNHSGKVLGGATGTSRAYIDLLIFDGENSIDQIRDAIIASNLTCPVTLHPFYKDFGDPVTIQ